MADTELPVTEDAAPAQMDTAAGAVEPQRAENADTISTLPEDPIQNQFLPDDNEFVLAKSFLTSKIGVKHPFSIYDHLTNIIMKTLEHRDKNIVDNFEQLSLNVKKSMFAVSSAFPTNPEVVYQNTLDFPLAKARREFLTKTGAEEAADPENAGEIPDIMDLASLWEWAGISFGKESTFLLYLSIKKLVDVKQLKSVRLWGKIMGIESNYIIVEAELKDGVADEEDTIVNAPVIQNLQSANEKLAIGTTGENLTPDSKLPQIKEKKYAPLSKEARSGVNKYIYYACSSIGAPWKRLPDVIPERLQEARRIRKYFTGKLDTPIISYPPFNGNEAQYLRCQIARISSATVISPKGYYIVDPDAEEPDESSGSAPIIINPEYEGNSNEQLLSISNWIHHIPYILPQGRVLFEAPKLLKEEAEKNEEEAEEEDEGEEENTVEAETGPAVLNPVNNDDDLGTIPCWSSRVCSKLSSVKFSPVTIRNNRWPGAFALAYNDKFANIYIGDGIRELTNPIQTFVPPPLGPVQSEYVVGEITPENPYPFAEQVDPTVEAEEAYQEEMKAKEQEGKEDGEEGEEGEEE